MKSLQERPLQLRVFSASSVLWDRNISTEFLNIWSFLESIDPPSPPIVKVNGPTIKWSTTESALLTRFRSIYFLLCTRLLNYDSTTDDVWTASKHFYRNCINNSYSSTWWNVLLHQLLLIYNIISTNCARSCVNNLHSRHVSYQMSRQNEDQGKSVNSASNRMLCLPLTALNVY